MTRAVGPPGTARSAGTDHSSGTSCSSDPGRSPGAGPSARGERSDGTRSPGHGQTGPAVTIHTDGACKGNPGPGGWGALLAYGERERELYGGEPSTTNNRMELTAVIRALEALTRPCRVRVFTDSRYVQQGIRDWIHGWKRNGWKTADRKPVKNVELWQELDRLASLHAIEWHWVKGHADDPGNARADALANRGVESVRGRSTRR